jgi:hypothetical protein
MPGDHPKPCGRKPPAVCHKPCHYQRATGHRAGRVLAHGGEDDVMRVG